MSKFQQQHRLMLFDLSIYGHHANYIRYLINYWQQHQLSGILDIVVIPQFLEAHRDVVESVESDCQNSINFIPISLSEAGALKLSRSSYQRNIQYFKEWKLLCKYAEEQRSTHCLLMYFDTYQLPLILSNKPPCQVSGIYFKPTFHYRYFAKEDSTWKQTIQELREKIVLSNVLKNPKLSTLFSLDNYVVKYLKSFPNSDRLVPLPDPLDLQSVSAIEVDKLRERLSISKEKQILLFFGALTPRKGIYQLLEAVSLLSDEVRDRLCLLLVGEASLEHQTEFIAQITQLQQEKPVQLVTNFEFVSESEVPAYFQLADLVLALYQRHVGMSGIILLAAAAGKPVLSADYGLMGRIVADYQLGSLVDAANPQAIALELTKFLLHSGEIVCNRSQMQALAAENSAERFAEVIFNRLLTDEF